ncbi:MAG: hypothetical protein FJ026_09835 [Chloroflexi bacterium]|nr:hypothetical protein [Chloroflexota bacterium]
MPKLSERSTYVAPRALRVASAQPGMGDCENPGSGDTLNCTYPGNTASQSCSDSGSTAGLNCRTGNAAGRECDVGSDGVPHIGE